MKPIPILISACLLGDKVKYSGNHNLTPPLLSLLKKYPTKLIPICPEVMGGLPTPRPPAEKVGDKIISIQGVDVSQAFNQGANFALTQAIQQQIAFAILKEKSPSCGSQQIYDGSFNGTLINGEGVTTQKLKENGFTVFSEQQLLEIEIALKKHLGITL